MESSLMTIRWMLALIAWTVAATAFAQQQPGAAGSAANTGASAKAASVQPALAPLVAPRAAELVTAGIQKIVARTGMQKRDIQVLTSYGPIYFAWPKNVTPVTFGIEVGQGSAATVRAAGYTEANKERYAAAFDAILPEALRQALDAKARAQRPRR
jgi:hypothetical protein